MTDSNLPRRDFLTIVSGLPRSGTSLMMQMLQAGGVSVLTDGVRVADDDNPHGYLEWEAVKTLKRDAAWVPAALGKAVKAIYWFLPDFPAGHRYRVIFLRRNLDEVLTSQARMLERRGAPDESRDDTHMKRLFDQELRETDAWLARQSHFSALDVEYESLVGTPLDEARRIDTFLGGGLDVAAMAAAVDPALYRSRT